MIFDKIANNNLYPFGEAWDIAFNFLASLNQDSEERKYQLSKGMFAEVMSYQTITQSKAVIESHIKYVDIQATISGGEAIALFPSDDLEIDIPYSNEKDVTFYKHPNMPTVRIENLPGFFAVLWPNDAHMPKLQTTNLEQVKKVIVKIPIELLKL